MNVASPKDPVATLAGLRRPPLAAEPGSRFAKLRDGARLALLAACVLLPPFALVPATLHVLSMPLPTDPTVVRLFQAGTIGFQGIALLQATRLVARWIAIGPASAALRLACGPAILVALATIPGGVVRAAGRPGFGTPIDDDAGIRTFALWCVLSFWLVVWSSAWRGQGDRDVDPRAASWRGNLGLADLMLALATCGVALAGIRFGVGFERIGSTWIAVSIWSLGASILLAPAAFVAVALDFRARAAVRGETRESRRAGSRAVGAAAALGFLVALWGAIAILTQPGVYSAGIAVAGSWMLAYVIAAVAAEGLLRAFGIQANFHARRRNSAPPGAASL